MLYIFDQPRFQGFFPMIYKCFGLRTYISLLLSVCYLVEVSVITQGEMQREREASELGFDMYVWIQTRDTVPNFALCFSICDNTGETAVLKTAEYWGTRQQLRAGKIIADWIDPVYGPLDPIFGVLLCPTAGKHPDLKGW